MSFFKYISTILHPIVIPTIGVMLYFLLIPSNLVSKQKLLVLSLVFIVTYLIPLLLIVLFKKLRFIKSYKIKGIKERKLPVALMVFLFYLLGTTISNVVNLRDLGILFYATSLALFIVYLLFFFKIKTSVHLLSLGIFAGFFIVLTNIHSKSFTIVIMILFLLAGVLASARLSLKAHSSKEIYIGFFIGLLSPSIIYYLL
ncbi:hypothetical protein [Polaribacter sp. Hel_I_88]|uniref:hypothetical protein n=1 Tax=Polaribacter sp. Hel_I_88 TaxID=1250006 RepID=UPI00047BDCDD|nr:hypothetical protein [Polaribacter sp. Hel_I_88]